MEPESTAKTLAKRLGTVADVEMRVTYLRHELVRMSCHDTAQLVACVLSGAQARDPLLSDLLQWLSLALADPGCRPIRDAVARFLFSHDPSPLAGSFWEPEPAEGLERQDASATTQDRTLTLGERKAFARRTDRNLVANALRDPHPDVIAIVLQNPILTESSVVALCACRNTSPEVLRQVFRSARWMVRYPIKVALVLNPNIPLDIGLQLTPLLKRRDLLRVLAAGSRIAPTLAEACRHMIERATLH